VSYTERLRLEPVGPQHADELFRIHSDPVVAEVYGEAWTREHAERIAREWAEGWERDGVHKWMAYDRATGELIGRGGLSRATVDGERRLELGWALLSQYWGQGYATEIGREGLRYAFEELGAEEVVSFTEKRNVRSWEVMERLGMSFEKEFVQNGEPFVVYVFSSAR